jgi:hypothetical protein
VFTANAWVPPGPGAAGSLNGKAVASEVGLGLPADVELELDPGLEVVVEVGPELLDDPEPRVTGPTVVGGAGVEVL